MWNSPQPEYQAELQWRFSTILLIPVLTLIAVPLSRVAPRQGRFSRLVPATLLYAVYYVLLQLGSEVVHTPAPAHPVTLAMALLKGDAFDDVLRRATELGVDAILPLLAEHGEGKLPDDPERALRRQDHWRSIAVSACEQCGRDWVPTVFPARTALSWLGTAAGDDMGLALLLEPTAMQGMADLVGRVDGPVTLAIGPEGGWSGPERRRAREHGVTEVALGTPVLRAETAPVAALAMLSLLRQVRPPAP